MAALWVRVDLWANAVGFRYRIEIPEGREPLYQWAGPVFLALAIVSLGLWLVRFRSARSGRVRALLWAGAGCLVVSLSAWWVWENRDAGLIEYGWVSSTIAYMPCVWVMVCLSVFVVKIRWYKPLATKPVSPPPVDGDLS